VLLVKGCFAALGEDFFQLCVHDGGVCGSALAAGVSALHCRTPAGFLARCNRLLTLLLTEAPEVHRWMQCWYVAINS
jgi:hypothetical protein